MNTLDQRESGAFNQVRWLLNFARPARLKLAGSIAARMIGLLLAAALIAVPAWAIGQLFAAQQGLNEIVIGTVTAVLIIALVKAVARYLEQLLGHLAAFSLMGEMRVWILERLVPQAPAVTDGQGAARIHSTAVRDVDRVEVFFAHTIAPAFTIIVVPVIAVAFAGVAAGPFAAFALALVLACGVLIPFVGRRNTATEIAQVRADIAQHSADTLRLRDDVIANDATTWRQAGLGQLDARLAELLAVAGRRSGLRHALGLLRIWFGMLVVLAACAPALIAHPAESLSGALIAVALVPGTAGVFDSVERLATSLPAGIEATRRIRTLAAGEPTVTEPETPILVAATDTPRAELRKVTLTYPERFEPVLRDVSLRILPGETIALAGATGSGKSTVARLLQRHRDADLGQVLIDGVATRDLGSDAVAQRVAIADQSGFVLDASVGDNLRLADPQASDEDLQWACGVAEFELPLNTPVGRRGARLSGGQRQRLVLARTLLRARCAPGGLAGSLLILDEATSHQDPLTQARMLAKLGELGATTLVIAHRLETLREADRIHVMEAGRIVESGTYEQLAAAGGYFTALLRAGGSYLNGS